MSTAADILKLFSGLARGASKVLPDATARTVAGALAEGAGMAADFISAGHDAPREMRRIRDTHQLLAGVERHWEELIAEKQKREGDK